MRNILITGCNGFIGFSLVNYYLNHGDNVIGVDISKEVNRQQTSDRYQFHCLELPSCELESILVNHQPEIIIHAAGSSSVPDSIINPELDFQKSVVSLHSLLESVRKFSSKSLIIFPSSAAVYGNTKNLPINEENEVSPISPYGYHKHICETLLEEYWKVYKIESSILRIFSIYSKDLKNRIFWDICLKAYKSKTITLFGSGNETRDYIHIADFIQAVDLVINKGMHNADKYNVGTGVEVSTKELASTLLHFLDMDNELVFNNRVREGDPVRWVADMQKIEKLGFKQTMSMNEGLSQYADWNKSILNEA